MTQFSKDMKEKDNDTGRQLNSLFPVGERIQWLTFGLNFYDK